jgi:hypothetical protein
MVGSSRRRIKLPSPSVIIPFLTDAKSKDYTAVSIHLDGDPQYGDGLRQIISCMTPHAFTRWTSIDARRRLFGMTAATQAMKLPLK